MVVDVEEQKLNIEEVSEEEQKSEIEGVKAAEKRDPGEV